MVQGPVANGGGPTAAAISTELQAATKAKEELEKKLRGVEVRLAQSELHYLESTWFRGNMVRGWEVALRRGGASGAAPPSLEVGAGGSAGQGHAAGASDSLSTSDLNAANSIRKGRTMKPTDRVFSLSSATGPSAIELSKTIPVASPKRSGGDHPPGGAIKKSHKKKKTGGA